MNKLRTLASTIFKLLLEIHFSGLELRTDRKRTKTTMLVAFLFLLEVLLEEVPEAEEEDLEEEPEEVKAEAEVEE